MVVSDRTRLLPGIAPIELTRREFALLEYLMRNRDRPRTKQEILDHVWGVGSVRDANVVEVYVGYLRKKLGENRIETVRGMGYRLRSGE